MAAPFAAVGIIVAESLGVFEDLAASAATRTSERLQLVSCIDWLKTRAFAADKTSKAANQSNTNSPLQIKKKKRKHKVRGAKRLSNWQRRNNTIQQEDNEAAAAAKETEKLKKKSNNTKSPPVRWYNFPS